MSGAGGSDAGEVIARDFLIVNQRGLHARASAKFVQLRRFLPRRYHRREGRHQGRRHLDHGPDDARRQPRLLHPRHRQGPEAEQAIAAIEQLIAARFGEEA